MGSELLQYAVVIFANIITMTALKKLGVILMNLGSPDSTELRDVRKYLLEFLMDGKVIDYPFLFRQILVGGIIVPTRSPKSAESYKTIWTKDGSPLVVHTRQLQQALQQQMAEPVDIAMRYGNPTIEEAYKKLLQKMPYLDEVIAVPLYPHYAMSSYETAVQYAREIHAKKGYSFKLNFIKPFFDEANYINA